VEDKGGEKARKAQETAQRIVARPVAPGVLKLGIPLGLAMALQPTFDLIDMLIVSDLPDGKEAVAALAICDLVARVPTILANGISIGIELMGVAGAAWSTIGSRCSSSRPSSPATSPP